MLIPEDDYVLLSLINTKLRDEYPGGLQQLCEDMDIDRVELIEHLSKAGYEYLPEVNRFR